MSIFQKFRDWAGVKSVELNDSTPIDILEKAIEDNFLLQEELQKAQSEFNECSNEFELKISACDRLIEKGSSEGEFNKKVLSERLDKITNEFLEKSVKLSKSINEGDLKIAEFETDILLKSIELTALLPKDEQEKIHDTMVVWESTGLIKGEQIENQTRAIVTAIDLVVKEDLIEKGGIGSGRKPKYGRGDKVHSWQNPIKSAKITHVHDRGIQDGVDYGHHYKVALEDGSSKWMHEDSLSKKPYVEVGKYHNDIPFYEHPDKIEKAQSSVGMITGKDGGTELTTDNKIPNTEFEGHYANVIVRKDNKILFLKRSATKDIAPNQYCLPGGHIDKGETIQQAGSRELKEEANLDCQPDSMWISAKAKCDDGKWAFYMNAWGGGGEVALLDGESQNASWFTKDEWMDADLFFDLKDHLIAMEFPEFDVDKIPTIKKAEEEVELEKADSKKKLKSKRKLGVPEIIAHAENTSSPQLTKISSLHPDKHIREAAKREIERRKVEADKAKKKVAKK